MAAAARPLVALLLLVFRLSVGVDGLENICDVRLRQSSVSRFLEMVNDGIKFIHLQLRFNSTVHLRNTEFLFDHYSWVWTYKGKGGFYTELSYPFDVDLLSLGTLSQHRGSVEAQFLVPENCTVDLGSNRDSYRIFRELGRLTVRSQPPKATGYLCYGLNLQGINSTAAFRAYTHIFGIVRYAYGLYCCPTTNLSAGAGSSPYQFCQGGIYRVTSILTVIQIVAAVLFCFSPLCLGNLVQGCSAGKGGGGIREGSPVDRSDYIPLEERPTSPNSQPPDDRRWIREGTDIYTLGALYRFLISAGKDNMCVSRLRRLLFVLLSPTLIYIFIISEYIVNKKELAKFIDEDIPLGFMAVPFGFTKSYDNWNGFMGGPYVASSLYFLMALVFIQIPECLGSEMAHAALHQGRCEHTFLIVDSDFVEKFGSTSLKNLQDFDLLHGFMRGHILLITNPEFWRQFGKSWISSFKGATGFRPNLRYYVLDRFLAIVLNLLRLISLFTLCLLESVLCILYYSLPVAFLARTVTHSLVALYLCPKFTGTGGLMRIFYAVCIGFVFASLFYVYIAVGFIFMVSFAFVVRVAVFLTIGMVIHPEKFAYVIFFSTLLFYFHKIVNRVNKNYKTLFSLVVDIVQSEMEEQGEVFAISWCKDRYLRRDVFAELLRRLHPVRLEILKAAAKLTFIMLFLLIFIQTILNYNIVASIVTRIIATLITAAVPQLVYLVEERIRGQSQFCHLEKAIVDLIGELARSKKGRKAGAGAWMELRSFTVDDCSPTGGF